MNLAFEHGYLRDVQDPAIKELPIEFNPTSVEDAFQYIKNHRTVSYYSVNFDDDLEVLSIDFGSHTDFCYLWDLNDEQKIQFKSPIKQADKQVDEETDKRRFAYEVLYKIKQMTSIPYDVAVAFNKILGEEY